MYLAIHTAYKISNRTQAHHILAEIIQGGLVLETNVEEIDASGLLIFQIMIGFNTYG